MDKEEARFILRCFRPDGADAENPDFAEALGWAAKDRELGEWLAHERAADAGFARALGDLPLPESLREDILNTLALERGERQIVPNHLDVAVMSAMASVAPPPKLRGEILAAMARTAGAPPRRPWWSNWRVGFPLAAAAGIALAIVISSSWSHPGASQQDQKLAVTERPAPDFGQAVAVPASTLTIGTVEEGSIQTLESPGFTLDLKNPDHHALFEHLKSQKLPCPNACLPTGLKDVPGLGCRELVIDGKRGALVCFKEENDMVHLVVFKRCDVKCKLPQRDHPDFEKNGKWSVARWADEDWVFMLLGGDVSQEHLEKMF